MRRLRAILVAYLVVGNLIGAIPTVDMKEEALEQPNFWRGELEPWVEALRPMSGITDEEARYATARHVLWTYHQLMRGVRFPIQPFFDLTRTNQQWGLFAVVSQHPERLVVEVRRNGEWEVLYRKLDPEHAWHDEQLRYRRIRGVWDSVKDEPKGTYKRLTYWIARMVFTEQADVDRVRVVLERTQLDYPWNPPDPTVTRRAEKYLRREKFMGDEHPDPVPADPPEPSE